MPHRRPSVSVHRRRAVVALVGMALLASACGSQVESDAAPAGSPAPSEAAAPVDTTIQPTLFGMHMHAITRRPLPEMRFGAIRLWDSGVNWQHLEPSKGEFDWVLMDKAMAANEAKGVDVLLVLGQTPTWASSAPERKDTWGLGAAAPPRDITDWSDYVTAVATRYKGRIAAYEVWNEPNLSSDPSFFTGTPKDIADLSNATVKAVKAVDPEALVISAGLSGRTPGATQYFAEYLAAGGAEGLDAIATHVYPQVGQNPEEAYELVTAQTRDALAKAGLDLPLWNTEIGFGRTFEREPERNQLFDGEIANGYVARTALLTLASGMERFYWYGYDDRVFVGLYLEDAQKQPTPAAAAFTETYRWLVGADFGGCTHEGTQYTCVLTYPQGSATAVWAIDGAPALPVPEGTRCLRTLTGQVSTPTAELTLGPAPVLLVSDDAGTGAAPGPAGTIAAGDPCAA